MKRPHLVREIIEIVALTLIIWIAIHFSIQSYYVEGSDMEPALHRGTYVSVNRMAYLFKSPERGDVIVFHYPQNTGIYYIKRVIGLTGDTVVVDATRVWINGTLLNEPYVTSSVNPAGNKWVVPPNSYLVMGDNRPISYDSRKWNFVPRDFIVGKAVMVYWPITSWQFINTYPDVFAQIKVSQ